MQAEEEEIKWTPEEANAAHRAQVALERALESVRDEEQAQQIIDRIEALAGDLKEEDIEDTEITRRDSQAQASAVEQAAELGPEEAIAEAARQIASSDLDARKVLDEAVGTKPEQEKEETPETREGRNLLRKALFKRLKPYDAVDAKLFLMVNKLPHPKIVDMSLSKLSWVMTAGYGWLGWLSLEAVVHPKRTAKSLPRILPALWLSTAVVEFGVKQMFRRKRPFISIVRAVVVGRKPGSYSFPSGHSAAAFAGDFLLSKYFPNRSGLFRTIAALTVFSRMYLGKHYPGDVLAGSLAGAFLARFFHWLIAGRNREDDK